MNAIDLLLFMGELGKRYSEKDLLEAHYYLYRMIDDGRTIVIMEDGKVHAFICFSICEDFEQFYKKDTWDYIPHYPSGSIIYIELMICRKWTKELRGKFEELIIQRYPQLHTGIWHKYAKWGDRKVLTPRRNGQYV